MKFYEIEIFFKMTIDTVNPYSEEMIESYDIYSNEKILDLLDKNHQSFKNWKKTDFSIRSKLLNDIALKLEKEVEEHAKLISIEMGKPIKESRAEVLKCAWVCRYYEDNAPIKSRTVHFIRFCYSR